MARMTTLEAKLTLAAQEVRRLWVLPDQAPPPTGGHGTTARNPLPDAWYVRESVTFDLRCALVKALNRGYLPKMLESTIKSNGANSLLALIVSNADRLAVWDLGEDLLADLNDYAHELHRITDPPKPGVTIEHGCGHPIRYTSADGDGKPCPQCGEPVTFGEDVRNMPPATASDLAAILARLGVTMTPETVTRRLAASSVAETAIYDGVKAGLRYPVVDALVTILAK